MSTKEPTKRIGLRATMGVALLLLACPWPSSGQEASEDIEAAAESAALHEFLMEQEAEALRENIQPTALVKIKIKINAGQKCDLKVGPRGVGACHSSGDDCKSVVKWRWIGQKEGNGERYRLIQIEEKAIENGLTGCFDVGADDPITGTGQNNQLERNLLGGEGTSCDTGAWYYKVTAVHWDDETKDCVMDPGVIIDN